MDAYTHTHETGSERVPSIVSHLAKPQGGGGGTGRTRVSIDPALGLFLFPAISVSALSPLISPHLRSPSHHISSISPPFRVGNPFWGVLVRQCCGTERSATANVGQGGKWGMGIGDWGSFVRGKKDRRGMVIHFELPGYAMSCHRMIQKDGRCGAGSEQRTPH